MYPYDEVQASEELIHGHAKHHAVLRSGKTPHRVLLVVEKEEGVNFPEMGDGEFRMLPQDKFPIHGSVTVRANHVFLHSHKSAILSVVIVSKEIADVVRSLFDLAWIGSSMYPTKKIEVK